MPRMTRGNVVLNVPETEIQHYLQLGYNLTTPMGKVIESAIPTDAGTLQRLYVDQKNKIQELESEIARLTAENESLKTQIKPITKKSTKTTEA